MTGGELAVLDHGFVALTDVMGHDRTAAQTARTSFRNTTERTPEEDEKLTRYLVKHRHTTPLEFCQARFWELLASMEAERQAYAAPKCCTDAAQGGGLCLGHMLSASSPHCGCRAALALAELMPVMDVWVGCEDHPNGTSDRCSHCDLFAAVIKIKESLQ